MLSDEQIREMQELAAFLRRFLESQEWSWLKKCCEEQVRLRRMEMFSERPKGLDDLVKLAGRQGEVVGIMSVMAYPSFVLDDLEHDIAVALDQKEVR